MRINLLSIALFVLIPSMLYCQTGENIKSYEPNVIPPNPSAFQFLTYGNIPVVNSTGTFTYSIPVYTINHYDITLPITLNYSSNGVIVDRLSSNTGTDWSINTGGIISRVMNGRPDEKSTRWYTDAIDVTDPNRKADILNLGSGRSFIDTEQDWFSFSINGISGSFFFDEQMKVHLNCDEYVKIEFYSSQNLSTFTITDGKGYRYVFGENSDYYEETTTVKNIGGLIENSESCITSWYLKEIESPTKNKITFIYSLKNSTSSPYVSTSLVCAEQMEVLAPYKVELNIGMQTVRSTAPTLTKIISGNNSVNFDYYNDSTFEGNIYLKDITLQYNNENIRKVSLTYDLIECNGTIMDGVESNPYNPNYTLYLKKRLFLKEVSFKDLASSSVEKYQFGYHKLNELPPRLSYAKDKYGFPGFENNSAFSRDLWEMEVYRYVGKIGDRSSYFTANLEVDPNRVYAGMLQKITYPTGGYTTIDYEPNYSKENIEVSKKQVFKLSAKSGCGNNTTPRDEPSFRGIVIDKGIFGSLRIKGWAKYEAEANCPRGEDGTYTIEVKNDRTNEILFTQDVFYGWWFTNTTDFDYTIPIQQVQINDMIIVTLKAQNPRIPGIIKAEVSYSKNVMEDVNLYGGGVRIKEITDYSDNNKYNKRKFYYNKLDKYPSEQSTMQFSVPSYGSYLRVSNYLIPTLISGGSYALLERQLIHINSSPYVSVYRNRNQFTNYTTITEINEPSGGAIERTFLYVNGPSPGAGWINGPSPLSDPPPTNNNIGLKDKIKIEKQFIKTPNGYSIQNTSEYEYAMLNEFYLTSNIFSCPDMNIYQIYNDNKKTDFISITQYRNYVQTHKLQKITSTLFEANASISKSTDYQYSAFPFFNLKKQEEKVSDGSSMGINYKYAMDMNGQMDNMDKLITANRVSEPIIIEKTKNSNILISSIKKEFLSENNLVLPQIIYNKIGNAAYYKYLSYDKYDENGRLLQYTPFGSIPTVFLWGYNHQYPIAEIKNATYAQIVAVLGQTLIDRVASVSVPSDADMSAINALRNNTATLKDIQITTYTYKPLVGMLSATNPSGITTYYDYDSFGRLKETYIYKDNVVSTANKQTIQKYDYHYQNQ